MEIYKLNNGSLWEIEQPEPGCWINVAPPFDHNELKQISTRFDIPLDFLTDSLDLDERSRYEVEDDTELILFNTPVINNGFIDSKALYLAVPVGIIRKKDFILTISAFKTPVIADFLKLRIKQFNPINQSKFILQIFSRNVYYYLHFLKELNIRRYEFERELYNSSRNKELANLLNVQKSLVYFVTNIRANGMVLHRAQRTNFLQTRDDEDMLDFLEDILIDNSQAQEMADVYTNILNGTMDAFASIISNNLGTVMKRLTSITIILMVPTLIASFYGMNVDVPFASKEWAFALIIAISSILSFLASYLMLKNKWL